MIPDAVIKSFEILQAAAAGGELALVEFKDRDTGEPRYFMTILHEEAADRIAVIPAAELFQDDPWDQLAVSDDQTLPL